MKTVLYFMCCLTPALAIAQQPSPTAQRQAPPQTATIRGRVLAANGRSVRGVTVYFQTSLQSGRPANVEDDGRYVVEALPPGSYRAIVRQTGFVDAEYGQRYAFEPGKLIVVRAGDVVDRIDITLQPAGAIEGRVVDASGDPVERIQVRLLQLQQVDGRRQLVAAPSRTATTDDEGHYRVFGVPPGRYSVMATLGEEVAGRSSVILPPGYGSTYYPGTAVASEAAFVSLNASQELTSVDISLSRIATGRVSGTLVDASGMPLQARVTLRSSRRSGALMTESRAVDTDVAGTFEFRGIPAGDWALQARARGRSGPQEAPFATQFVRTSGRDVDSVRLQTAVGSRVTGRVVLEASGPVELSRILVTAIPFDTDLAPADGASGGGRVAADGIFVLDGLVGPRLLRVDRLPDSLTLRAVRLAGRDVTDEPLTFGTRQQSLADVEVVLASRVTGIAGTVNDVRGQPVSDFTVLAFSTEPDRWTPASRYVVVSRPTSNGTFTMDGLPAGDYYVAALEWLQGNTTSGEWQDRQFLESLISRATRMTLADGQTATLSLRLIAR